MALQIKKAVKEEAKLRMFIAAVSGGGKTFSSISIMSGLCKRILVADTENKSASKYAGDFPPDTFDVVELQPPFHPRRVVEFLQLARAEGYDGAIIDSLSPFWNGTGGILELVDEIADRAAANGRKRDTFAAWNEGTKLYREMMDAIIHAPIHVIATARAKMAYEKDETGKKINKVGYAPEFKDGAEYEFDIEASMDIDHRLAIGKTRVRPLDGKMFRQPGRELGEGLARWLSGAPAAVAAPPAPVPVAAPAPPPVAEQPTKVDAPPLATPSPKPESERRPAPLADSPATNPDAVDRAIAAMGKAATPAELDEVAAKVRAALKLAQDDPRRARLGAAYSERKGVLQKAAAAAPPPLPANAEEDDADNYDRGAALWTAFPGASFPAPNSAPRRSPCRRSTSRAARPRWLAPAGTASSRTSPTAGARESPRGCSRCSTSSPKAPRPSTPSDASRGRRQRGSGAISAPTAATTRGSVPGRSVAPSTFSR